MLLLLPKTYRSTPQTGSPGDMHHFILEAENVFHGTSKFTENLCHTDKGVRIANLRILCHFKQHGSEISAVNQPSDVCPTICNNFFLLSLSLSDCGFFFWGRGGAGVVLWCCYRVICRLNIFITIFHNYICLMSRFFQSS